jgi:hypothetical protein
MWRLVCFALVLEASRTVRRRLAQVRVGLETLARTCLLWP